MFWKTRSAYTKKTLSETAMVEDMSVTALQNFRQQISSANWAAVLNSECANEAYDIFIAIFVCIYKGCFKFKKFERSRRTRKPWVSRECLAMIRKKSSLYAQFVKSKNPDDLANFKRYRNGLSRHLRRVKQAYFNNVFNESGKSHPEEVWRKLNTVLNHNNSVNDVKEIVNNNTVLSGLGLAEAFNMYFINLINSSHNKSVSDYLTLANKNTAFLSPTMLHEIHTLFSSINNSNARDIDGLRIKPIKFVLDCLLPVLNHIFNLSLSSGVFPEKMKRAKVIVIHKSVDKNNFSNYRPISILPIFSKALEKVISARLISFCEKHSILSPSQFVP